MLEKQDKGRVNDYLVMQNINVVVILHLKLQGESKSWVFCKTFWQVEMQKTTSV